MIKTSHLGWIATMSTFFGLLAPGVRSGVQPDKYNPIATCEKGSLPDEVDRLIKPVLLARVAQTRSGTYIDKAFETAFYKFLDTKGKAALEAKVALMAYYVGEHYGEELSEAVLEHPNQADVLVRRYTVKGAAPRPHSRPSSMDLWCCALYTTNTTPTVRRRSDMTTTKDRGDLQGRFYPVFK